MNKSEAERKLVHKVGCTRSTQSAILVREYLAGALHGIRPELIAYHFTKPSDDNGFWLADILITTYGEYDQKELSRAVDLCRAFVAGRGEIW